MKKCVAGPVLLALLLQLSVSQAAETDVRQQNLHVLLQGLSPSQVRCNEMAPCTELINSFLAQSGIAIVPPLLRAATLDDASLPKLLAACKGRDFARVKVPDGIRAQHEDRAEGPITIYALPRAGRETLLRVELDGLRRDDRGRKPEPLHAYRIVNRNTCETRDEHIENQDGLLDKGFVRYRDQVYRYQLIHGAGVSYHALLLERGGPEILRPGPGLYAELR